MDNFFIYWEKQGKTKLCGLHCINCLLQGPYYNKEQLDDISFSLIERENKLYEDNLQFNYQLEDGNYNIMVIIEALKIFNIEITQIKLSTISNLFEEINSLEGFILNSSTHWFCIRKINDIWFSLNSANIYPGPQIISNLFLIEFLKEAINIGFSIFITKNLPKIENSSISLHNTQNLVSYQIISEDKPKKINLGDTDDMELEQVIEKSKKDNVSFHNKIFIENINEMRNIIPDEEKGENNIDVTIIINEDIKFKRYFPKKMNLEILQYYINYEMKNIDEINFSIDSFNPLSKDLLLEEIAFISGDTEKLILYSI